MAKLLTLKCSECEFYIMPVWGHMYCEKDSGERISLPHPSDDYRNAARILIEDGHNPEQFKLDEIAHYKSTDSNELMKSRVGMYFPLVCQACSTIFYIDCNKDPQVCGTCHSFDVKQVKEDMKCPKCKMGQMEKHGRALKT